MRHELCNENSSIEYTIIREINEKIRQNPLIAQVFHDWRFSWKEFT